MCVIVAKPIGVDLPDKSVLETCFYNNDDGAGFCYNENNMVIIKKGFMNYGDFEKALNEIKDAKDKAMLLHFRISTHGLVDGTNTHPFPVTNDFKMMARTHVKTDLALAHNGIIASVDVPYSSKYSDTMVFIKNQVSLMQEIDDNFYLNDKFKALLSTLSMSKLSFIDKVGNIVLIGQFIESKGCFFSNSSYEEYKYTYYTHDNDIWTNPYYKGKALPKAYVKPLAKGTVLTNIRGEKFYALTDEYFIDYTDKIYYFDDVDNLLYYTILTPVVPIKCKDIEGKGEIYGIGELKDKPWYADSRSSSMMDTVKDELKQLPAVTAQKEAISQAILTLDSDINYILKALNQSLMESLCVEFYELDNVTKYEVQEEYGSVYTYALKKLRNDPDFMDYAYDTAAYINGDN